MTLTASRLSSECGVQELCVCLESTGTYPYSFFHKHKTHFLRGGYNFSKCRCATFRLILSKQNSPRRGSIHRYQGTYLLTDHSKGTDYIVSLVWSTSGRVFSLASLWWIRKECLLRFLLSLWCFQVIVHTSHPFPLVTPSGMPTEQYCQPSRIESGMFRMTCLICNYLLCNFVRQHIAHITHGVLAGRWSHCHYPGKLLHYRQAQFLITE